MQFPTRFYSRFGMLGPMCVIFNSSIREGFTPTLWKVLMWYHRSNTPQLKDITNDVWSIALTATLKQILESIVGDWLRAIVKPHIKLDQYGAVKGSSTCHAIVDMLHHWYKAAEKFQSSRELLLDCCKAFDIVDHNIIITKLTANEVPNILFRWVDSFLAYIYQRVCVGE